MSFVSYAQNFEDVMLWRALKHIENGFYVDVGAQHPVIDSVSKAFYERGWRGIHIEPVPQYAELLRKDRPDETVLQIALADTEGTLELNLIPDTGLSTFVDAYAQRHRMEVAGEHQRIQVPVLTLKSALTSLVGKDVHWLKIDVEGFEEKVLKGWDSQALRPWIIVVEATIPVSPETNYASWEPILTAARYQFVYFDGLNRFYVSNEHAELAEAFSCPPNIFDNVRLSGVASSELCRGLIESQQATEKQLATKAEKLATELNAANEHNAKFEIQTQWLQNEWDTAKQRVEELCQSRGRIEAELTAEQQKAERLTIELNGVNERSAQLQAHAQWLQNEWDAAKQRVEELSQRTVQLGADLQAAREHESQLKTHAQWLQNEWDAAKAKIDELNWELQSLYASKSWRITWPLRKTMQAIKWVLALPLPTVRWAIRLPKRVAKPVVVWTMRKTLSNPRLKSCALNMLDKHPQLKLHLRQFAIRSGLLTGWSPRAARIYADLKRACEASKS
jgi:FkbM family methyltransferase